MKPVGFSQWNTPRSHPPDGPSIISEGLQISNGCAKNPAVSGPLAANLSQSLTPRGRLSGPSLAPISDICSGLGFHSRGGQRESICSFKRASQSTGCWWGGMRNPHHFSCWHHWCAILHPFPINATTTQSRLSYPPTAPDWQASDSSGDEEERVWMEIERCHVWTLPKEARPILGKKKAPRFQPFLASRPWWLFEDLTDCADVFI